MFNVIIDSVHKPFKNEFFSNNYDRVLSINMNLIFKNNNNNLLFLNFKIFLIKRLYPDFKKNKKYLIIVKILSGVFIIVIKINTSFFNRISRGIFNFII